MWDLTVLIPDHCLSIYFGIVISTFLYACDSWILTAELEKRTQAFKTKCYQRLNNSAYKVHITNEEVLRKIQVSQGRKKSWLDRDSNPGPLAYRASTLPTELPSHMVVL